jgi:N-sulfoglucosamine sulfohydrolase
MIGFTETHRPWEPTTTPLGDVRVPPYLPDLPDVLRDMADLNAQVERVDRAVGSILEALDRTGQAERTLFVSTTDHGLPFPRAKATLTVSPLGAGEERPDDVESGCRRRGASST